jgi:hypothetical protein
MFGEMSTKAFLSLLYLLCSCGAAITIGLDGAVTLEVGTKSLIRHADHATKTLQNRASSSGSSKEDGKSSPESLVGEDSKMKPKMPLSASMQATLGRMHYYAAPDVSSATKPITDKFLMFSPDEGGPNNIRIGWEMSGLVARKTGRTLVLPPAHKMYLLDYGPSKRIPKEITEGATKTKVEDLINLVQLKANLPTLTAEEFEKRTGTDWESASKSSTAVSEADICKMDAYNKVDSKILYMSGSRREGFNCAAWWLRGGPKDNLKAQTDAEDWSLLTHGFVWHEDAFNIAANVVNQLGIFDYSALHARYNDFQFHDEQKEVNSIFKDKMSLLQLSPKLYVASDDPDRLKTGLSLNGTEMVTFDDMVNSGALKDVKDQYTPERWFKMLGPAEELICTFAKVFLGTGHSTFSGHINRMRLHSQAPTTRMFTFGDKYHDVYEDSENSVENAKKDIAEWTRLGKAKQIIRATPMAGDAFLEVGIADSSPADAFLEIGSASADV